MYKPATVDHHVTAKATLPGATVIDLNANPDDCSPAINHIVAKIQDARAASQKVIILLGECHDTILHGALPSLLFRGLEKAGSQDKPALALERSYNLLEDYIAATLAKTPSSRDAALQGLANLKKDNNEHYRRLQTLRVGAGRWPDTPVTRLESISECLNQKSPIYLVDMAVTRNQDINIDDPVMAEFVKGHSDKTEAPLNRASTEGVRLGNLWMMAALEQISNNHNVTLFHVGLCHLGGYMEEDPYKFSLHAMATKTDQNVKIISVFPEQSAYNLTYASLLSAEAQNAMDNPDTIIIRGGNASRYSKGICGSMSEEISTLRNIFKATGLPDCGISKDENDYEHRRKAMETLFRSELEQAIG